MAKGKVMCTCAFLLLLNFSYGIISSEARPLKAEKNITIPKINEIIVTKDSGHSRRTLRGHIVHSDENISTDGGQDFPPTTPGHSPGIGHSAGPEIIDSKP